MLVLQVFPAALGLRNASPFCFKAEVLLDMSGLAYRTEPTDPRKAPHGKLPVLVDDGEVIPDTGLIQRHLERKYGIDFDPGLSERDKAEALAWRRLIEEHLYWALVWSRWLDPENAPKTREAFFKAVPAPLRGLVFRMVQKKLRRDIAGHGLGLHKPEAMFSLAIDDIEALAAGLGDKPFFFGEQPSSVDAALYPTLENILKPAVPSPLKAAVARHPAFALYCDRMRERFPGKGR